jgi:predicted RNA binding protein YcfA (HicA-like mRNA interferase family)
MPRLPTVKPQQVVRALEHAGFEIDHRDEFVELLKA